MHDHILLNKTIQVKTKTKTNTRKRQDQEEDKTWHDCQIRQDNAQYRPFRRSRSFKVTDFGTNRKLIYGFLYQDDS